MRLSWGKRVKRLDAQADRTGRTELGDFTANSRLIFLALVSLFIGGAAVAVALLRLIAFCSNLFFFHRWSTGWRPAPDGSSKFLLATAALAPGIFCSVCHEGQWHWDCPLVAGGNIFLRPSFMTGMPASKR